MLTFLRSQLLVAVFTFLSLSILAQNATVRGFVYDAENGEPIIFTNVYLKGTAFGTTTDVNGYYSISKIPAGDYALTISYLGYDTLSEKISLTANQIITKKLYLTKGMVNLNVVEISAESQEAKTEVQMSVQKITPKDMKQIPTIGGTADIAQYLQVLPGVVFTGDQGGQLYIRGGSPIQNKVLLDGMVIYNPFHSIGLFSVFDTDVIRNADVYTGGFNAEYGGRISSVMDITTKDGNTRRHSGVAGISPFGAKLLLEGPLSKPKPQGGSSSTFILSAKNSYLTQSSKVLYSYIDTAGLPFNFTDLYAKATFNSSNGSKFNVFGFNFRDRVNYQALSDLNWNNYGFGSNFVLIPTGSPVLIDGIFAYSSYGISLQETAIDAANSSKERFSGIDGFNLGLNFTYFVRDNEIKYGIEVNGFSTDFTFYNSLNTKIQQQENTTEIAGYLKYKYTKGKLVIEPSFRAHYYASLQNFSPEPRLGGKFNFSNKWRMKFAAGLYSQNLISANSDRDVVNLFYGFLSSPDNLQKTFTDRNGNDRDVTYRIQKATHLILGSEVDITKHFHLNVEGYYKFFNQLSNTNRNKIFEDNAANSSRPDLVKKDFIVETGKAYGVDFVFKYEYKRFYLWAVYSLAYTDRWDGVQVYNPVFDRRHNVNLVGHYTFGKNLNWEASARWNLGSGFPFTQTQGYYESLDFTNGVGTDYTTNNGSLGIQYADLNQGRLPYYHRLDINIKHTIYLNDRSNIEINVGATNMYNRANIFYFDRIKYDRVNQLPLMPSVGVNWSF